jgi:hypothetical protein
MERIVGIFFYVVCAGVILFLILKGLRAFIPNEVESGNEFYDEKE